MSGTLVYAAEEDDALASACENRLRDPALESDTTLEVANETTLHAARRLIGELGTSEVAALNFASAKHPGGGFLGGSRAQEESLARASGLYACLAPCDRYYEANRALHSPLYTDAIIYSPRVPAFRDDDDALIDGPFPVSFITAPAVNAGAVRANHPQDAGRIEGTMLRRMEKLLSVAAARGETVLVLGAWGCGVFRNDCRDVARWFAGFLTGNGRFRRAFRHITFAVLDHSPDGRFIEPFRAVFAR